MERPETEEDDAGGGDGGSTRFDPASFSALVIGLATQAQMLLGVIANPMTHQKEKVDLPRAKGLVDLLGMLGKKTDGNLTREEAEFLKRVLADLRMRYVKALSGGSADAP